MRYLILSLVLLAGLGCEQMKPAAQAPPQIIIVTPPGSPAAPPPVVTPVPPSTPNGQKTYIVVMPAAQHPQPTQVTLTRVTPSVWKDDTRLVFDNYSAGFATHAPDIKVLRKDVGTHVAVHKNGGTATVFVRSDESLSDGILACENEIAKLAR